MRNITKVLIRLKSTYMLKKYRNDTMAEHFHMPFANMNHQKKGA